jgi:hypothetical protein
MSKAGKIAAILLGSAAVMLIGSGVLLAWTVTTQGVVRFAVDDRESGTRFDVPVPAALVGAGLSFVPLAARHHRFEHRAEMEELKQVAPAALAFFEALEDAPDAVLVDVRDGEDWVRIVKSGRDFEVLVESPDANVRFSMPTALFRRMLRASV